MDIAMVLGGAVIAMLQGMDPDGKQRSIDSLHKLANRASCSPAEGHIFQVDVLPAEQRDKIVAVWRAAAACREDKNDLMAAYFLHQLAGDEMPAPRPKPKLSHLKIIK
jgi:hypothetical protein